MDSDGQLALLAWPAWPALAAPGHPPPDMIGFNTSNPNATNQIAPDGV